MAAAAAGGGWRLRRRGNLCISYGRRRRHAPPVQTLSRGSCASGSGGGGGGRGTRLGGGTCQGLGAGGTGEGTSARGRRRGRWALRAHPRIAARRGSPGPADWCAPGAASRSRPEGGAPRTRPRRAAPAPAPAPLPPDSPSLPQKRACLPTPHPAWGGMLLLSLGCRFSGVRCDHFSKWNCKVESCFFFLSVLCEEKKKKLCASPSTEREWLSNKRANKISWVEIELYKCFPTRKSLLVCALYVWSGSSLF